MFHSGAVKFSPCYPAVNHQITLPTPASWHFAKGIDVIENNKYHDEAISNHASADFIRDNNIQYKQCRDGFLTNKGVVANVSQGTSTKTALDRATGSAKEGQLFTYSYINSQQAFIGFIDSDDEVLLNKLKNSLTNIMRIGRSRNSEFGRVNIKIVEREPSQTTPNVKGNEVVIWCLSDCEIINRFGMPTLAPTGNEIHPILSGAHLIAERSFIRANRLSRFNQKRQGLDSEQQLICKGSILTYHLASPLTQEQLITLSNQGIGSNQQLGLGWINVNPHWAMHKTLSNQELFMAYQIVEKLPPPNDLKMTTSVGTPLTRWLLTQAEESENKLNSQKTVDLLLNTIYSLYQNARRYNHILHSNEAGPSKTQWGRIREVLSHNNDNWKKILFDGEQAICKANNDELGWGISLQGKDKQGKDIHSHFADEIYTLFTNENNQLDLTTMRLLIEQLGRFELSVYKDLVKAKTEIAKILPVEGVTQ